MSRPPIPYAYQACPHRARYRIGRWHWWLTDGETGPELCRGTARTEWGANRRLERALKRCVGKPGPKRPLSPVTALAITRQLNADGIPVTVCAGDCVDVCATCPVTTEQEVAALAAVLAATDQRVNWREAVSR
jgi:hypothetical protein